MREVAIRIRNVRITILGRLLHLTLVKVRKSSLKQLVSPGYGISRIYVSFPSMRITEEPRDVDRWKSRRKGRECVYNERFVPPRNPGLYASVIVFVAELRCVKYKPIVNESGSQVAFPRIAPHRAAPRRHPCPSLPIASTPYSSDTESADAESNSGEPKSIPRWPTTPWPSLQLNPFAAGAVSNANVVPLCVCDPIGI